jgi:D-amino peptidase
MRFYISADIEGIAGVVSPDNLMPGRFEYEQARDWMTEAVLAACETVREAGAEEVVVSDSHGNGQNIRFERMPSYVQLVRSWPRPLGMMQGVELGAYDGALLIGYHAGATNSGGTLAHTMNGEFFLEVRLNGLTLPEAGISGAIAGHFGVPVLMVAGDDVAVQEARSVLGDVAVATLKTSLGRNAALNPAPAVADFRLRAGVRDALMRVGTIPPYVIAGPVTVEVRLRNRFMAEWLAYVDEIARPDANTVRYEARDMVSASRFLMFLTTIRGAIG